MGTPKLAQGYSNTFKAKGMEIVFISSDQDEKSFKEYFGEQPWVAVPFGKRDIKDALSKKYDVRGIPSLVILDGEGKTITTEGRAVVSQVQGIPSFVFINPDGSVITTDGRSKVMADSKG